MAEPALSVSLDAVIVRMCGDDPQLLAVHTTGSPSIPSGPLDPDRDRTLERALRRAEGDVHPFVCSAASGALDAIAEQLDD